jgi:transcriptional regulator with XRE-family HTH domain
MTTGRKTKAALEGRFAPAKVRRRLSVGQSVRIARELNELSQNELAGLTGIAQSTISAIETDRVKLGAERAKTLARALRVHPAVLLFPGWRTEDETAA